jgi:methionine-rich copper-binding protein CopC
MSVKYLTLPYIRRVLVGALLFLALGTPTTMAHTALISATPANESVINSWPSQILLTFAEDLQTITGQSINLATVTNSAGNQVSLNKVTVDKNKLVLLLKPNSVAGVVLVNYRVAAQDGHVIEGEYTFTFNHGKSPASSPSSSPTLHSGDRNSHLAIFASTTVLIVIALLFGWWAYRKA